MKQLGVDLDLDSTGPIAQNWTGTPVSTIGRLFFTHGDNGRDSYCTATSVRSGNHDVAALVVDPVGGRHVNDVVGA
jgi:hypothetical protein